MRACSSVVGLGSDQVCEEQEFESCPQVTMRSALSALVVENLRAGRTLRDATGQKSLNSNFVQWSRGAAQGRDAEPSDTSSATSSATSSGPDSGEPATAEQEAQRQPKKSRTGGDMTDDGQVITPNLWKNRSTRELFQDKAAEKKTP